MVTTSKTSLFAINDISVMVKTESQSTKGQPVLWLIHGSGGISSNEGLWQQQAYINGWTVVIVDSYTNRGIFKQYWETREEKRVDAKTRADDQIAAYNHLLSHKDMIPYADLDNIHCVGFSDGGLAAIWLQSNHNPDIWKKSYALYPPIKSKFVTPELLDIRNEKVEIFVGEKDDWTPAKYCLEYKEKTNCNVTVYDNAYHSFSKPGINNFYHKILNDTGEKGVTCKYDEAATVKTLEAVFGKSNEIRYNY